MTSTTPHGFERKPWMGIFAAILYFGLYEALSFAASLGYSLYLMTIYSDETALEEAFYRHSNLLMIILDVVIFLSLSVIVLAMGKRYSHGMGMKKTRPETIPVAVLTGAGLSCVLNYIMAFVSAFFPKIMEDYNNTMDMTYNMGQIVLYILACVVGAPLIEELIFRHFMAGKLAEATPRILAILLSSIVFGLVHQHIVQMIYAGALGLFMACVYFAYDSVWASIAVHAGFNAMSLISLIDTSKWSEAQQNSFYATVNMVYLALALVGIGAAVFLFVRRTHYVWRKYRTPTEDLSKEYPIVSKRPATVQWDDLLSQNREIGSFPSVAELVSCMNAPTPLSADCSVDSAVMETNIAEASDTVTEGAAEEATE